MWNIIKISPQQNYFPQNHYYKVSSPRDCPPSTIFNFPVDNPCFRDKLAIINNWLEN